MTMTRQDFELIAETIRAMCDERDAGETMMTREGIAATFARALAATNPWFDQARFLRACGVNA